MKGQHGAIRGRSERFFTDHEMEQVSVAIVAYQDLEKKSMIVIRGE